MPDEYLKIKWGDGFFLSDILGQEGPNLHDSYYTVLPYAVLYDNTFHYVYVHCTIN